MRVTSDRSERGQEGDPPAALRLRRAGALCLGQEWQEAASQRGLAVPRVQKCKIQELRAPKRGARLQRRTARGCKVNAAVRGCQERVKRLALPSGLARSAGPHVALPQAAAGGRRGHNVAGAGAGLLLVCSGAWGGAGGQAVGRRRAAPQQALLLDKARARAQHCRRRRWQAAHAGTRTLAGGAPRKRDRSITSPSSACARASTLRRPSATPLRSVGTSTHSGEKLRRERDGGRRRVSTAAGGAMARAVQGRRSSSTMRVRTTAGQRAAAGRRGGAHLAAAPG